MPAYSPVRFELSEQFDPRTFMQEHWQNHPVLIRQAIVGLDTLITAEELAGIACDTDLASRLITGGPESRNFIVKDGPFSDEDFTSLPDQDWTLLVQDLDKLLPECKALLDLIDFIPSWRKDDVMISFAAPGGSVGPHLDAYDVMLVQLSGKKQWQIDERPDTSTRLVDGQTLRILDDFTATSTWIVEPGDVLYLPPGVPHHGIGMEDCLAASIGFRAPSSTEMLLDLVDRLALSDALDQRFVDRGRPITRQPGLIDADTLTQVGQMIRSLSSLDSDQISDWFGCYITEFQLMDAIHLLDHDCDLETCITLNIPLIRNPSARVAYTVTEQGARLYVNGSSFKTELDSARLIADQAQLEPDQIKRILRSIDANLLSTLYDQQVLLPQQTSE